MKTINEIVPGGLIVAAAMVVLTILSISTVQAKPGPNYIHLQYVTQSIGEENSNRLSDYQWGAGFEAGSTFFVHRAPLAQMLWIGFDWSYLDLTYAFKKSETEGVSAGSYTEDKSIFGSVGMKFGPSLTVNPFKHVNFKAQAAYVPSFTLFSLTHISGSDEISTGIGGYAGYFSLGASASWRFLTLGFDWRTTKAKLHKINGDSLELLGSSYYKLPSTRVYLGFRF